MRDDRFFLVHMLEHLQTIQTYTQIERDAFLTDTLRQDAVIRQFEILGEASRNLSPDLRNNHPHVPWSQIAGFRNFLIHVYWQVDPAKVWDIVQNDLPPLKPQLEAILQALDANDEENNAE